MAIHETISSKIESLLFELGLNKYEARVYITLIAEGVSTAKTISDITNIPYGKVYEIINSLALKGFVTTLPTKPMKCKAVSPREVIQLVKKNMATKLKKVEEVMLSEMEPLYSRSKEFKEPKGIFWILNGRSMINKKIEEMVGEARSHIHIFTSANGLKRLQAIKQSLRTAKKRGVQITITSESNCDKDAINVFNFCTKKQTDSAPCTLFSVDGNECLLIDSIPDDDSMYYGRDLAVWISNPKFVKMMEHLYSSHFDNSLTLRR